MKIFIPVVGTRLKLKKSIKVKIKKASQNNKFAEALENMKGVLIIPGKDTVLTLPKDLVLEVDRVYVRQGSSADFNSVTFKTEGFKDIVPKGRFFVSIDDVNNMDVEILKEKKSSFNLKNEIQKKWRSYDFEHRKSCFEIIENMNRNKDNFISGSVYIDLRNELFLLKKEVKRMMNEKGYSSFDDLKGEVLKHSNEKEFELIKKEMSKFNPFSFDKVKALDCKSFNINGETVLLVENVFYNNEMINDFHLFVDYARYIASILEVSYDFVYKFDNAYRYIWEAGNSTPKFGIFSWTNGPIYYDEKSKYKAYLLEKVFAETAFLNTKKSKNYGFSYYIDGVGDVNVSGFRKELKKIISK